MTNLWGFLLQTLSVTLVGLLLLVVKEILKDKLTPRWQYFVWSVLALRVLLPVSAGGNYALLPLPVWVETWKSLGELGLSSAYTSFYQAIHVVAPIPWLSGRPASITDWLFLVYVAGVVAFLVRYLVSYLRLRRLLRWGSPASQRVQMQIASVGARYGLAPCQAVVLPGLPSPMVCGVFRPVLALPRDEAQDDHVLLHELLHVKYHDALQNVFWCLCRALHWCNPLVHLFLNRVGNDLESLCDQRVLERLEGEERRQYGVSLLAMANDQYSRAPGTTCVSNGGKNIARRIEAIVRFRAYPKGMALASICVTVILLSACLVGVAGPDLAGDHILLSSTEERISTARLTRCTTVAGALDTYAKGLIENNDMYLMIASPLAQRAALEDRIRENGQIFCVDGEETPVTVYTLTDAIQLDGPGREERMAYSLTEKTYGVCHLQEAQDGSVTALLLCHANLYSDEAAGGQGIVAYPVRVYEEDGYVVEPVGQERVYIGTSDPTVLLAPQYGYPFLTPDQCYQASGASGTVEMDLQTTYWIASRGSQENDFVLLGENSSFNPVPNLSAEFTNWYTTQWVQYTFGGSAEEKQALASAGVQIVWMPEGESTPDFSEIEERADMSEVNAFGNGSAGLWANEEIPSHWGGTIESGGGTNALDCSMRTFAARIFWNGTAKETLILKEVPASGAE